MEAVKVRIQTTLPPFAKGITDGVPKFVAQEGTGGLFKSLPSLWSRQIPYTMMKVRVEQYIISRRERALIESMHEVLVF